MYAFWCLSSQVAIAVNANHHFNCETYFVLTQVCHYKSASSIVVKVKILVWLMFLIRIIIRIKQRPEKWLWKPFYPGKRTSIGNLRSWTWCQNHCLNARVQLF